MRPFAPNRRRFSSGWGGITLNGMLYFVASILFMPPDDFIACDIAFVAFVACDIAFVAFVARMRACDGNLKKIRLSDCLKTVWEFSGGTENLADVFLHDIRKRICFPHCFFLLAQKRNEKRDSFTTARRVSSCMQEKPHHDDSLQQEVVRVLD
jgi:hypothetical protein